MRPHDPWLYLCAGMRRGGSTVQAQLVSELLGGVQPRPISPQSFRDLLASTVSERSPQVLKCHEFLPEAPGLVASGTALVFHVHRDLRDVVASISRKYSIPVFAFIHGGMEQLLREHADWRAVPGAYLGRYEDMVEDLPREVSRLAAHMGIGLEEGVAGAIAGKFSIDKQRQRIADAFGNVEAGASNRNRYDSGSLLHRDHIRAGGRGSFRRELRWHETAALEWQLGEWLHAHGYATIYPRPVQALAHFWFQTRAWFNRSRLSLGRKLAPETREFGPK